MNASNAPRLVFLFSGHMIDKQGRKSLRFPPDMEPFAAAAIERKLDELEAGPQDLALCGGACGGDLLFAEACLKRGLRLEVRLPFEEPQFLATSVTFPGGTWGERFSQVKQDPNTKLLIMPRELEPLPEGENPYVYNNVWQLEAALSHGASKVRFLCLWNGRKGDAAGGTEHMYNSVAKQKGRVFVIDSTAVLRDTHVYQAIGMLKDDSTEPEERFKLARHLKADKEFGYARQLLEQARKDPRFPKLDRKTQLKMGQQHAICTYKDPDLPAGDKFDDALKILQATDDLATTINQETLGLAGAIYKRKWELGGQRRHLEQSFFYYHRGHTLGVQTGDLGYTGINAAFVLDLLAHAEATAAREANGVSSIAEARLQQAEDIRNTIIAELQELFATSPEEKRKELHANYWYLATLAEAQFGLQQYEAARDHLRLAAQVDVAPWEYETTARQLAAIARLHQPANSSWQEMERSRAWAALREFLGHEEAGVATAFIGKVGLALSGGGFRASLFHIGVLAKLAELDLLRHMEVLSCVSGGSIVGAHYYLELRKLLQTTKDGEVSCKDYVDLIHEIEREFLKGVQRNIRTRIFSNWWANLKMLLPRYYSRSHRLGELYEEELYSRVTDGGQGEKRWLNQLFVKPVGKYGEPLDNFAPKRDNWGRKAKIPMLVVNATTLNTGHNWQFTASWMGEPPNNINTQIDKNPRLRRMYYKDAPVKYRNFRLGQAVAASACVPGAFNPITLPELYPDFTVRLVDGGVHDNQGVASLLEQDCTVLFVSDASGQMEAEAKPGGSLLSVPLRSTGILQARVRDITLRELGARKDSGQVRGLIFLHLKKDVEPHLVDWISCDLKKNPSGNTDSTPASSRNSGVRPDIQLLLAAIRTDLDVFSDAEAYSLMISGYRMMEHDAAVPGALPQFPPPHKPPEAPQKWDFERISSAIDGGNTFQCLMNHLAVSCKPAFRVWRLAPVRAFLLSFLLVMIVAAVLLPLGLWNLLASCWHGNLSLGCMWGKVGWAGLGVAVLFLGWGVILLHLYPLNWLYLRLGSINRFRS